MRPIHLALGLLASCGMTTLAQAAKAPADICVELVGWLDQRQAQAPTPAGQQAAVQPSSPQQRQPGQPPAQQQPGQPPARQQASGAQETGPRRDLNTAVEQPRQVNPQKPGGRDEPQRTSGMTGPVTSAGPGAAGPQGDAQETAKSGAPNPRPDAEQRQGAQAPKPKPVAQAKPPDAKPPAPDPQTIEQARRSAQAQNHQACRAVVRDMRLAGVALPGPLIALAALRADYAPAGQMSRGQGTMGVQPQQGPAPGVPPIPPSGIPPAAQPGGQPR